MTCVDGEASTLTAKLIAQNHVSKIVDKMLRVEYTRYTMNTASSLTSARNFVSEFDELFRGLPNRVPATRSFLDGYSHLIAVGLVRLPPLSYAELAAVLNEKFKRDGRTGADGNPLTVTRQGVNNFVLRRRVKVAKRAADAHAVQSNGTTENTAGGAAFARKDVARTSPTVAATALAPQPVSGHTVLSASNNIKRRSSLAPATKTVPATALDKLQAEMEKTLPGFIPGTGKFL